MTSPPPFCAMGEKVDFVCLIATMPGRHSGDQVHKIKKTAAPSLLHFTALGSSPRASCRPQTRGACRATTASSMFSKGCGGSSGTLLRSAGDRLASLGGRQHSSSRWENASLRSPGDCPAPLRRVAASFRSAGNGLASLGGRQLRSASRADGLALLGECSSCSPPVPDGLAPLGGRLPRVARREMASQRTAGEGLVTRGGRRHRSVRREITSRLSAGGSLGPVAGCYAGWVGLMLG